VERRLAAILAADVAGYTALMGADEAGTLRRLTDLRREFLDPLIDEHHGRIVKLMGDGFLVEFASVVNAVTCAIAWQDGVAERAPAIAGDSWLQFRIGINLGDVIVEGDDIHGDGVNIAARLEGLAEPGGICLSGDAYRQAKGKVEVGFEDMGEKDLKNVADPVSVYHVVAEPSSVAVSSMTGRALPLPGKPSIAVLPFTNMSDDPEQDYFTDGITEDIITELSRFREFVVIARNSTFQFKDRPISAQDVGNQLGVRYVVEGSVRRSGNRIRVTAQLIDSETGAQAWAERYDRELEDIFAIQDEVTAAVVARLEDRVKGARVTSLEARPNPKMSAYDLVLQSRPYRTQTDQESSLKAAELLRQAIVVDPKCAQAYAGLAFVMAGDYEQGWVDDPEATLRDAMSAAERAVSLDGADGYSHASFAYVSHLSGDFDRAVHEARVALSLNPNHVNIIMTMGWISVVSGDPEAGIRYIERARQLNPSLPGFELWTLGEAYLEARRYQDAVDALMKVPNPPTDVFLEMAIAYAYLGECDKAQSNINEFLDRSKAEMPSFQYDDPRAWRALFEQTMPRRRKDDVEHFIEGARKAGLPV